jgi:hypothetical protein
MKWAITKEDLQWGIESLYASPDEGVQNQIHRVPDPKRDALSFTTYASRKELEANLEFDYALWAHLPFTYTFRSEKHYMIFRKHYEIFVGGYLYYYDERIRSGAIDHTIYFKWKEFSKGATQHWVRIFMSPKPLRKKDGQIVTNRLIGKVNGKSALADPPNNEDAVDPPKPPAPPPPDPA